jgi:hypothetical protein
VRLFQAFVDVGDPPGIHKRLEWESESLQAAKKELEERYGVGTVMSVWDEVEANRPR